ncbi:MAG: Spy/CpxP family protein refolding chaperone [Roseiarcus sp.]|jgi:Spy/CpxP family protein refolding chaperone
MTSIDNAPLQPEPPIQAPQPKGARSGASPWPRALALVGVLAGGVALGVGGAAAVAAGMDHMAWRQGAHLTFVQRAVARALDSVGASAAQEAKVHDIVAAKFAEIAPKPDDHEALRKQALDLLAAPTIDRAAVERLRIDAVATFDAKSKALVGGLLDVADQLTPAQRAQLAAEVADMPRHGPMMGGWGGPHDRLFDGRADGAPDTGPDKE